MTEPRPSDQASESPQPVKPPLGLRVAGQTLSWLIARVPLVWPLLRRPTLLFWERNAKRWDRRINPDSAEHLASLEAACDRVGKDPTRICEIGTGTGSAAFALARRFPVASVDAVDLSPSMISAARAKLPDDLVPRVRFSVADAASLPFADGSFDLVVQLNVPVYFGEAARVLCPGGHMVIASSLGPQTPYYTPHGLLQRGFAHHGLRPVASGQAGAGTFWLARLAASGIDGTR